MSRKFVATLITILTVALVLFGIFVFRDRNAEQPFNDNDKDLEKPEIARKAPEEKNNNPVPEPDIIDNPELKKYYSVQIMAAPDTQEENALEICNNLLSAGYEAYYYPQGKWFRVRAGLCGSEKDAEALGNRLKKENGYDFFICDIDARVYKYNNEYKIIYANNELWLIKNKTLKIIHRFEDKDTLGENQISFSDDYKKMAFYDERRIFHFDIYSGVQTEIPDVAYPAYIELSPDGSYIAYLDDIGCDTMASLWLIKSDDPGSNTCLIRKSYDQKINKDQSSVKYFCWHPNGDKILYIDGYAYGSVSPGGDLFCVDLEGKVSLLLEADNAKHEEITSIGINGEYAVCTIVAYDEDYNNAISERRKYKLADLMKNIK